MTRSSLPAFLFAAAIMLGPAACASSDGEASETSTTSAFTVGNGDRFVVSATPKRIVLKKSADGVDFPFDEAALQGKAVLIHAIKSKADEGVYARAIGVTSEKGNYVIDAKPLTLDEMAKITEDEIVRIYIDAKSSTPRAEETGPTLTPKMLHPNAVSVPGVGLDGFNLGSGVDLSTPVFLGPGVTFKHTIQKASFSPEVLLGWSSETGLDLGFRGELQWGSTIVLGGRVAGEIFRSASLESPRVLVYVPIGPIPVPVTLHANAFISCFATVNGPAEVTIDVAASAKVGGSLRVLPSSETAPTEWIKEGPWPAEATGTASAKTDVASSWSSAIICALPRIEVHASVAGLAGPYFAVSPRAMLTTDGPAVDATFAAGLSASMTGIGTGVEMVLYTWKP